MLANKRILLIIGGGIAAYKSLDLIRRLTAQSALFGLLFELFKALTLDGIQRIRGGYFFWPRV